MGVRRPSSTSPSSTSSEGPQDEPRHERAARSDHVKRLKRPVRRTTRLSEGMHGCRARGALVACCLAALGLKRTIAVVVFDVSRHHPWSLLMSEPSTWEEFTIRLRAVPPPATRRASDHRPPPPPTSESLERASPCRGRALQRRRPAAARPWRPRAGSKRAVREARERHVQRSPRPIEEGELRTLGLAEQKGCDRALRPDHPDSVTGPTRQPGLREQEA